MMKKILLGIFSFFLSVIVFAQDTAAVQNADREPTGLRADGKIYVVLAVAVVILTGLFVYLIRLDRKLTRLEKGDK
jgi:CcmD family protein